MSPLTLETIEQVGSDWNVLRASIVDYVTTLHNLKRGYLDSEPIGERDIRIEFYSHSRPVDFYSMCEREFLNGPRHTCRLQQLSY